MLEWGSKWLKMSEEERLEAAKLDAVPYTQDVILEKQGHVWLSEFMCNCCRQKKPYPPYGYSRENDGYSSRYYCQQCLQKTGLLW
jgi:hypothetical protein